jgi:GNAT acetyltransferase-like protein
MTGYEIRALEEADDESARAAWNTVFARGQGAPERTAEQWSWSYARNPAGRRAFGAFVDGRVVALYAALPVATLVEGVERTFAQIVDSLVLQEHRAGLKRPGLFVEVGRRFFERHGSAAGDCVFFGWPVEAAWRAGERFLAYGTLRQEIVLGREPGPGPREIPAGVERLAHFDHQARWLYDRCCGPWGASTIRDARWLTWRYLERPGVEYRLFGVRDREGVLRALAVQRTCAFLGPRTSVLVDWLAPEDEPEVAEVLLAAVLAGSRADEAPAVCTLVPPWSRWFGWFQERGFAAHASDYVISARSFSPRHDLDWLRERWWYQLGDSDLV